jgi:3,4-dihydroxyphthalate decarboxylase
VPIFPRSVTVTNDKLAAEMLAAMGDRDVVLMRGHGISVYGRSVETATTLAIRFDSVARIMWQIAMSGRSPIELSDEDMAEFNRPGRGEGGGERRSGWAALPGVENWSWNYYVKMLEANNIGLPDDDPKD